MAKHRRPMRSQATPQARYIDAIQEYLAPAILGHEVDNFENLMLALQGCILKNTSAKAARYGTVGLIWSAAQL